MSDDLGKSVRDKIAATASVKAIAGPRIFADFLPQKPDSEVLPAVVVFVGSMNTEEDLSTTARVGAGTVNVWTFANDRTTANLLAKAIRDDALAADLRGSVYGMDFLDVSLSAGPSEAVDPPNSGGNTWRRVTQQTFTIWASPT